MSDPEIKLKIDKLILELNDWSYRYYVLSEPIVSDAEYDKKFRELEELEKKYPQFVREDSATKRVGSTVQNQFKVREHKTPMLSLANAMDEAEILEFDNQVKKVIHEDLEYTVEYKFDGVAVSLSYENGFLKQALTRGDGIKGEDITSQVKTIKSVPLSLAIKTQIEIRGEVVLPKEAFKRLNKSRIEAGEEPFANPRNVASGSLRQLDTTITASRPLAFYAYSAFLEERYKSRDGGGAGYGDIFGGNNDTENHFGILELLEANRFLISPNLSIYYEIADVILAYKEAEKNRNSLPFEVDGIVVKVNNFKQQEELGVRSRTPRWAIACKFAPVEEMTKLLDIQIQVGRTGALTPVALLESIKVGGVTVSRATLHNEAEILRKGLMIGDTVIVRRQGDVIPAVVAVVQAGRDGTQKEFQFPKNCPICSTSAIKYEEDDAVLRCPNFHCAAKLEERIVHFASRNALDIEGLGEKNVKLLLSAKLIKDVADIYDLKEEKIAELPRMGELSAKNLISAIDKSKRTSLHRFIFGLGIRHIGARSAKVLSAHFGSIEALKNANLETLCNIREIGEESAKSIIEYFTDKEEKKILDKLLEKKFVFEAINTNTKNNQNIKDKVFVVTGTLTTLSRDNAHKLIEENGGRFSSSVSKKTDFLLAGSDSGSKLQKALELGIKVIDEDEFLKFIAP